MSVPRSKKRKGLKMGIFARLAGCAYLIYIMIKLLKPDNAANTDGDNIAIVMIVLAVVVIGITIYDLVRALKNGVFNASTYDDTPDGAGYPPYIKDDVTGDAPGAGAAELGEYKESGGDTDDSEDEDEENEEEDEDL